MTNLQFTKAVKTLAKLRLALFGPSGGGKTLTALRMAKGIGGRVAVIDTERGSASKYSDRFEFDTLLLEDRTLNGYIHAIQAAAVAAYDVLIIDSLTHGWRELLDEVERLARAKFGGNTWAAWSEGTPKQQKFIDALLNYPGHIIATMRSKTEWTFQVGQDGRKTPLRIGLAPEEGKGIEYEFDLLIEITPDHVARVLKDRTGKFQDKLIDLPGEEFGASVAAWLQEGAAPDTNVQRLAFLLPVLIGSGTLGAAATMKHLTRLLAVSPFCPDMPVEQAPSFQIWVAMLQRYRQAGATFEKAAEAANAEWAMAPKEVGTGRMQSETPNEANMPKEAAAPATE